MKLGRAESEHGLSAASLADPRFADYSEAELQILAVGLNSLVVNDLKGTSCRAACC